MEDYYEKASLKKAEALIRAAIRSVGRVTGAQAAEVALKNILIQYELLQEHLNSIEVLMQELLLQVPNGTKLMDIKGIGMVTAAVIISEVGDIHRFVDPRQIQKMAGLNLRENSSGRHKGKTTISKRGRRRLREGLFRAMIPILANNTAFKELHQHNLTRPNNPLNKMQSIIALCGKLIRIIFAILSKGITYNSEKMTNDIKRPMKAAA